MCAEVWKHVPGTYDYEVSSRGKVRKVSDIYILKTSETFDGYLRIRIKYQDDRGWKDLFLHRLVAEVFLSSWDPNLQVNHIDGDKKNNSVENLEMVTNQQNIDHFNNAPCMEDIRNRRKKRISIAMKRILSDPEVKSRHCKAVKDAMSDPKVREHLSRTKKEVMRRTSVRTKISEAKGIHVLCIQDKIAFSSLYICSKFYNVDITTIQARCENGTSSRVRLLKGKEFKYLSDEEYNHIKSDSFIKIISYM